MMATWWAMLQGAQVSKAIGVATRTLCAPGAVTDAFNFLRAHPDARIKISSGPATTLLYRWHNGQLECGVWVDGVRSWGPSCGDLPTLRSIAAGKRSHQSYSFEEAVADGGRFFDVNSIVLERSMGGHIKLSLAGHAVPLVPARVAARWYRDRSMTNSNDELDARYTGAGHFQGENRDVLVPTEPGKIDLLVFPSYCYEGNEQLPLGLLLTPDFDGGPIGAPSAAVYLTHEQAADLAARITAILKRERP